MDFGKCRIIQTWSDWDYSLHTDEAQISRQGRAMTYPFDFEINEKTKSAQFSSTSDLPYYDTTLSNCDCHDFQKRKLPCKHIYRLAVELGLIEIINRPSYNKKIVAEIKGSIDIDNHPEQVKRQKSAMDEKCTPAEINYEDKTALFAGSGKEPYETTIDSCTCRDFSVRKLPCKHIYRLRFELDGVEVRHGVNKNEYAEPPYDIFALPAESQELLYDMCVAKIYHSENLFIYERNEFSELLLHKGFCIQSVPTPEAINAFPVSRMKRALYSTDISADELPKKAAQRKTVISCIEKHFESVAAFIDKYFLFLEFSEYTNRFKSSIHRKLAKIYGTTTPRDDDLVIRIHMGDW